MKRAIGLLATTARAAWKKRGFSLQLAASAAGHIHVPGAALECRSFMLRGRAQRDGQLAGAAARLRRVGAAHPVEICNEVAMRSLENSCKAHLIQEKQPFFGTRLISGASSTAAAPGGSGFDFFVVDLEHAPIDAPQAIDILATRAR